MNNQEWTIQSHRQHRNVRYHVISVFKLYILQLQSVLLWRQHLHACVLLHRLNPWFMYEHFNSGRCDRIVVEFTTTCAISAYHHYSCEFESHSWRGVLDLTLFDKYCQCLQFSPGTPVSFTNNPDRHDISEMVESDIKHHCHNLYILILYNTTDYTDYCDFQFFTLYI